MVKAVLGVAGLVPPTRTVFRFRLSSLHAVRDSYDGRKARPEDVGQDTFISEQTCESSYDSAHNCDPPSPRTNIYAEVDLEMKAKALATCEVGTLPAKHWKEAVALMRFLRSL
jgi:hypothetical protein